MINGVGHRLYELRQKKDISLDKLSSATGISKSCLSRCENGVQLPSLENAYQLANYYGVTLDYIVSGK